MYEVVGHRGFPEKYPENSLPGVLAAIEVGAKFVEFDVQMSKDGVPLVIHDATLNRVCGIEGNVADFTVKELEEISCHEAGRFEGMHDPCPLVSLKTLIENVSGKNIYLFVELKSESLAYFSREAFYHAVKNVCESVRERIFIISFDTGLLELAKPDFKIGWVLHEMTEAVQDTARRLQPEVLAYDVKKLNEDSVLWSGGWDWFLYDIIDPKLAEFWAGKGVRYIETWDAERLLKAL